MVITKNSKISENFTYQEIFKHDDLKTLEPEKIFFAEKITREVLQPARDILNAPINIISGYRNIIVNAAAGGVKNSKHLFTDCAAVDINVYNKTGIELFTFFVEYFGHLIGGIGLYYDETLPSTMIHIDYRKNPVNKITTWYRNQNNNYVSIPEKYKNIFKVEKEFIYL